MKKIINFLINPYLLGGVLAVGAVLGVFGSLIYNTSAETYWDFPFPHLFYIPLELGGLLGIIFFIAGIRGWIKDTLNDRKTNK